MRGRRLAWVGGLVMIAATVAFVVDIAVAGLGQATELATVVSALFALGGLALAVFGLVSNGRQVPTIDLNIPPTDSIKTTQWTRQTGNERSATKDGHSVTNRQRQSETNSQRQSETKTVPSAAKTQPSAAKTPASIIVEAVGTAPWTVKGHGLTFSVISVTRTMSRWEGEKSKRSITVTADVMRTKLSDFHNLEYRFSNQENGFELEKVPFESQGRESPALNQRSRLIIVLWDTDPPTTTLRVILRDFYWSAKKNLILKEVPVLPAHN